jgi:hypothetical protein
MPMTQVWVRVADGWQCLAGHAGPGRPGRCRGRHLVGVRRGQTGRS